MVKQINRGNEDVVRVRERFLNYTIYALFFMFALLGFRYQALLLSYREWGDESETIVAAKMMAAGMRLYSEVFNHHGPLTFLPGIIVEKIGNYGVNGHRVPIALLQIIAVISIYKTPIISTTVRRIVVSVAAATMILVFMPDLFGHMYKYQTIAGLLLVIILSQYALPAIFSPEVLTSSRVVFCNALIASLPFLAVTYLPITVLLFFCSLRARYFRFAVIGSFLGLALNSIFLGVYGSFPGFFAFHIYLNAAILPLYVGLQPGGELIINALKVATSDVAHFFSLIILFLSAAVLAVKEKGLPWRTLLLVAGICSLLMRGAGFQGMPYFYSVFALFIPAFIGIETLSSQSKYVAMGFVLLSILKISLLIPGDKQKILSQTIPAETEFSRFVQEFTTKDDRIIAFSFQNFQYLVSNRLPASGHFFYLPWQEKYNKNPKFGVVIDACEQIRESKPKVMLIDKWMVWDRYSWDSYAGCVQGLVDDNYFQVPGRPYYIRKDLVDRSEDFLKDYPDRKMIPSLPLDKENSISLRFSEAPQGPESYGKKLVGLGVMLGTHVRVNPGTAGLLLRRANGPDLKLDFSLPELVDNSYKKFDLPEDTYVSGEIVSLTGGGVSVWRSHSEDGEVSTCLKYFYSDGSRGFTPGCPAF